MSRRVAYVCADPGIPPDGSKGASVHFRSVAQALASVGVSLDVLMARDGDSAGFAPHRVQIVGAPRGKGLDSELALLGHAARMREALSAAGPHAAVYERLSLFGLAGLAHARALSVPLVVEVNAPLWQEAQRFRSLGYVGAARGGCLDVMQGADKVLAVTHALADQLVQEGVPAARIEVLGNGTDVTRFRRAEAVLRPPALRGRPTLVFVGSLKPWHGVDFLLEAFAALRDRRPECALWIVGDGPERARVHAVCATEPEHIVHTPAVPHEAVPGILKAADVVVAPYTAEAPDYFSPLKLIEVLAAGRPLLASRAPCVLETLRGHQPPGLFEPGSIAEFVAAAERLFALGEAAAGAGIDEQLVSALDWRHKAEYLRFLLLGGSDAVAASAPPEESARG